MMLSHKKKFITRMMSMATHIWLILVLKWVAMNKVGAGDGECVGDDDGGGANNGGCVRDVDDGDYLKKILWNI
jgi:hypothetical protein